MASSFEPFPASAAAKIASYSLTPAAHPEIEIAQAEHRLRLVNFWRISPSSRVLEIGCGQGNCTAVLAEVVGPKGHVDAVDPASPDYGRPFTLAQAQEHLTKSAVGDRISWHNAQPTDFLANNPDLKWDYVVFTHCIWYFDSPDLLAKMIGALKGRAEKLLIAEYALQATEKASLPHLLAATARASLEAHNPDSAANIRCLLGPGGIKEATKSAGWAFEEETVIIPEQGLLDGFWEATDLKREQFVKDVDAHIEAPRVKVMLKSAREAVINAIDQIGGNKQIRTMDVWVASFN